jgi:hypothetical protein
MSIAKKAGRGCGGLAVCGDAVRRGNSKKINCRHSLVGAVDVVNGQDGQVAVITEITQGDARTSLELVLVDGLLGGVEGNGHGEDVAIGKAVVLADTGNPLVIALPHFHF